jgi:ATP-dependent helicase/nuclease subunit A
VSREPGTPPRFEPADQAARRQAIETLDRPLLVEAGAGTGKTTLLVARLLHGLETGAVRMPGLVAISFTEKAAAELRLRLRQRLEARLATPLPEAVADRLRVARHELDQATLCTIHAFAAAILRRRPVEARLDPQFRTLDELESRRLLRGFWHRWLDTQLEGETAARRLRRALLAGVRLEPDLYLLSRALYEQRDAADLQQPPPLPADLEGEMRALRDAMLQCVHHAEASCNDPDDLGLVKLRQLAARLAGLDEVETSSWPGIFLQELTLAPTAGRKEAWRPGEAARSKQMRVALRDRLAVVRQHIADELLHDVLVWLQGFRVEYAAEKRRRGVLDFEDLLLCARGLVRDDLAVRRDLSRRIDMLCVDEFQDTDPLQAELVLYLAEDAAASAAATWQDVRVDRRLFLVGDPKQSIYRFRRADLEVYARCAEIVLQSGGLRLDIVQNFRSRTPILQWVNGVFASLFAGAAPGEPHHVPLVPAPEDGDRAAVWILKPDPGPAADADALRRREAEALAAWLARALHDGWPVRDDSGAWRAMRPGDAAILFGRTSGIEYHERALRDAGLPFQQEGGRLFFQRQEVRDVLHALAAIDDPHDDLSIVAALRSPLFGATDEDLVLHRTRAASFDYLSPPGASPLAEPLATLRQLHAERHARGIAGTLVALLERTRARAVQAVRPQAAQALANYDLLLRQARSFEAGRAAGLREFVRALRDLDRDPPRLAEWSPEEDREQRVRLLTVHVAKGLEFPCVLLANLNTRGSTRPEAVLVDRLASRVEVRLGGTDVPQALQTAGYEPVAEAERRRDEAEARRLLYVAVTRARDYLVVADFAGRTPSGYLKALAAAPGALGEGPCGALPRPAEPGAGAARGAAWCVVRAGQLPPAPAPAGGAAPVALEPLLAQRAAWAARHAERLRRGQGGARILRPPDERPETRRAGSEDADERRARQALQRVLQRTPAGAERPLLELAVREAAAQEGIAALEASILEWALAARDHALEHRAARARRVWRGLDVVVPIGDALLEARLDLVLEEPAGFLVARYVSRAVDADEVEAEAARCEEDVVWRAAALAAAGCSVHEAGSLFLAGGRWLVVEDLEAKMARLRARLGAEA